MNEQMYSSLDELLHKCIHCGMCLPVCPTYNITYREESSPRGRIRLMKSVHDGTLPVTDEFVDEMYFCLDCQACQTACPAGVRYGELVEDARTLIAEKSKEPRYLHFVKTAFLKLLESKARTKLVARLIRLYQRTGLREAVDESGILSLFSEKLSTKHSLLPHVDEVFFDESFPEILSPNGSPRGRVAFLSGCIMNVGFGSIHRAAVDVLLKCGYEVIIPKLQACCGSLHAHNGEREKAKALARRILDVFRKYEFDALVVDSAGCAAFIKEYGEILADDEQYASLARDLSGKTKEITEFLSEIEIPIPRASLNKRVTYHEACHLVHGQNISRQPRELLRNIPGIEFVELPEATWCCGSAGIYNITRFDDSMKFLQRKMENVATTGAVILVTANPGCHLQLQCGLKHSNSQMEVLHPVELLARVLS